LLTSPHACTDLYTDKDSKVHVRRLKNLLEPELNTPGFGELSGAAVFSKVAGMEPFSNPEPQAAPLVQKFLAVSGISPASKLGDFYPTGFLSAAPKCYNSLTYSAWNPPPRNRQLQGDLYYLVYETLEKKEFHLTASSLGFFLNGSNRTTFNSTPNTNACFHSFFDLLSSLDHSLQASFVAFQEFSGKRNVYETVQTAGTAVPWCLPRIQHTPNQTRSEDYFGSKLETIESPGQIRDWNDEFQGCRELTQTTVSEKLVRERALHRSSTEFLEAAQRGAIAVIEGNVLALNPNDPAAAQMFLYNNIFLSYAVDGRDSFKALGGNPAAHHAASKDLQGVLAINSLNLGTLNEKTNLVTGGLHTPLTAVIDYKGNRVVAQSMIPGILRHDQSTAVRYGGIDAYQEIRADPAFHSLLEKVAEDLHLAKHTVTDQAGKGVELITSADFKGIIGGDDRKYLLDLYRIAPVDANFVPTTPGGQPKMGPYLHQVTLLRLELVALFYEERYLRFLRTKIEEKQKAKKEEIEQKKAAAPSADVVTTGTEQNATSPPDTTAEDIKFDDEELKFSLTLNPDVFTSVKLGGDEEKLEADRKLVVEAADYLLNIVVPSLVGDFFSFQAVPLDSGSLTDTLHSRGINMRYLGKIVQLIEETEKKDSAEGGRVALRFQTIKSLLIQEMIIRAAKHAFRAYIANTPSAVLASRTSHFLNCLLSDHQSSQIEFSVLVNVSDSPFFRPPRRDAP